MIMTFKLTSILCCVVFVILNNVTSFTAVQALATPSSARSRKGSRERRSSSAGGGGGGGGFGKKVATATATATATAAPAPSEQAAAPIIIIDAEAAEATSKRAVSNLFSVCSHIQNPKLYRPKWADACTQQQQQQQQSSTNNGEGDSTNYDDDEGSKNGSVVVVATRDVDKGHVLTLFPIHALGLRTLRGNNDTGSNKKKKKKGKQNNDTRGGGGGDTEFVAYDEDADGEVFRREDDRQKGGLRMKLNIPLDAGQPASSVIRTGKDNVLFSTFLPAKEVVPGWLGGRIRSAAMTLESNCVTIPLPGAAPLCAVVATRDVKEGEEIIQGIQPLEPRVMEELRGILAREHAREISTLSQHIEMACETARGIPVAEADNNSSSGGEPLGPFHQIDQHYPGLKRIHRDPDIYEIENFLTDDECDGIIAKSKPHLAPCLVKNEKNGNVERDPVRTSTNANVPQREVPTVLRKITDMTRCDANQLEILQVLNYRKGQEFVPHTDGFSGPYTACGFEHSTRLVTVFCYLNDVARGGTTCFPGLNLDIVPRKGMAVIHFPADENLREDERTLHQGKPAIDDKWLLTTWVWKTGRSDDTYAECKLPSLSGDII